jgi:hypothetical protein
MPILDGLRRQVRLREAVEHASGIPFRQWLLARRSFPWYVTLLWKYGFGRSGKSATRKDGPTTRT